MSYNSKGEIRIKGEDRTYYRINNDVNGNPRYVMHHLDLDIEPKDYGKVPGLTKYRAKWFGGGYVFQSYNLESDLEYYMNQVDVFYGRDENKY